MANIIDIILRGHDQASTVLAKASGELKAVGGHLSEIQPLAAQAAGSIGGMGGALASLGASAGPVGLLAAGVVAIGTAAFEAGVKLAEMGRDIRLAAGQTGLSTDDVQVFKKALESVGLDSGSATLALATFNRKLAEGGPLVKALGLDTSDTRTALMQLSAAFASSSSVQLKAKESMEFFSRAGRQMSGVIEKFPALFQGIGSDMRNFGALVDTKMIAKMEELHAAIFKLSLQWQGAWLVMLESIEPVSAKVVLMATQFAGLIRISIDVIRRDWVAALKDVTIMLRNVEDEQIRVSGWTGPSAGDKKSGLAGDTGDLLARAEALAKNADAAAAAAEAMKRLRNATRSIPGDYAPLPDLREFGRTSGEVLPGGQKEPGKGSKDPFGKFISEQVNEVKLAFSPGSLAVPLQDFREFLDSITDASRLFADALHLTFDTLAASFEAVFQVLIHGGESFRDRMHKIVRQMADAIIAELSRIIAKALLARAILAFLGVPTTPISAPISPIGETPIPSGTAVRQAGAGGSGARAGGGNTYNIQAISARDVFESLVSPGAPFRTANDRLAELSA